MIQTDFINIGAISEFPKRGARRVELSDKAIAIFRTAEDQIYALNDNCPHKQGRISEGIVHGDKVACPLHNWVFSLRDGEAQFPDEGVIACYETKVIDDQVFLRLKYETK